MQNRDDDTEPTAAERAFDALRAEVAGMRQAVQSLSDVITKIRPTTDYTETLGAIAKKLETVGNFMAAIEQHPAIRTMPAQYNQAIVRAGEGMVDSAVRRLDSATAEAVKARHELAGLAGSMRGQQRQFEQLFWTGFAAVLVGLLISPLFARLLPFGLDGRVASFILHADRWDAGSALMQAQSPQAWRVLMDAGKFSTDNSAALAVCREAAAKAHKEQRCNVVVPAP
jgi:hypothetical protein